jgi:hypothetical protein
MAAEDDQLFELRVIDRLSGQKRNKSEQPDE